MTSTTTQSTPSDQSEAALGAAEFDALLDAAVDGIAVIDDQGRVLRFNKAAERMFGYSASEVLGKSIRFMMPVDEASRHDRYMGQYLRTGTKRIIGIDREVRGLRKDGSTFPVSLAVGEVRIGEKLRFVGLMRDLTSEKQAEEEALRHREQMMHASRLTTMGEMAAAMAHEINQPLSAIATYTAACIRLLGHGPEAMGDVRAALHQIGDQAHRAGDIIQRIRNFTRSRELSRRRISVQALFDEIRPLVEVDARAHSTRLVIAIQPGLPAVTVDTVQIQQVLLNLLRNGIDAMEEIPADQRELRFSVYADTPQTVRIDVVDRGRGISAAARDHLFIPFFTTKATGMGMGLAISRSIVTAHAGQLDCANNPDGGATFHVILPTAIEE